MDIDNNERVYRKILVPLDGSEAAEAVLEVAKGLAVRSGAVLALLHVFSPEQAEYKRLHSTYVERVTDLTQQSISKMCETVQCYFGDLKATVLPVLAEGEPAAEIVRYATENNVTIVLMATHGRTGSSPSTMSDIANRVIRNSQVPVWLIRTASPDDIVCAEWPPKRVLVPLDGSEKAEKALSYAVEYAKLFDAEVALLRVCDQPEINADYPEANMRLSWDEHIRRVSSAFQSQCSLYLTEIENRLKEMGLKVTAQTFLGNAAEEIIKYVRQNRCDLIAMTTYGRSNAASWASSSPVGQLIFSNVTEQVLAASSRGILVVRGQ